MKCQIIEYDEATGEIGSFRTFDAQQIPWQPSSPGKKQMIVDAAIADEIERVENEKGEKERKVVVDTKTGLLKVREKVTGDA